MKRRTRVSLMIGGAVIAVAATGGVATAASSGETDTPITGDALTKASAAALAVVSGEVTATEIGDEESYYEVEVTKADGSQVDVQLDEAFAVVSSAVDDESK